MQIAPERFASRRDTIAFLICIVLSVAGRVAPVDVQRDIASAITSTVLAPFLAIQEQVSLALGARTDFLEDVAVYDSITALAQQTRLLAVENERLRELLDLSDRLPVQHVSAEVLYQADPRDGLALVISAGSIDGVKLEDPVVAPGGIVGVVKLVQSTTSTVLVWMDTEFRASAVIDVGGEEIFGIVAAGGSAGLDTWLMELRGVAFRGEVPVGATVRTSGQGIVLAEGINLGGVYPAGIPIGTVTDVGEEREGWSRTYQVKPAVNPLSLSHVIVLTGPAWEVGVAFEDNRP